MENILIVDDNISFQQDMELLLKNRFHIIKAINGNEALTKFQNENIAAILLDLKLPDADGLDLLEKFHSAKEDIPVIIITEVDDIESAVVAMKSGAVDYIQKALNVELLSIKIKNALEQINLKSKISLLQDTIGGSFNTFVFISEEMKKVDYEITRFARFDVPVLILGETGVGKDLAAFQIHKRSKRNKYPFISVPIRSLSEELLESELFGFEKGAFTGANERRIGKFEGADHGTIYLPEISELSKSMQLKLLEFLQYKTIQRIGSGNNSQISLDVRLILASNENLESLVAEGRIREDFYYRIKVGVLYIPSLWERKEDIKPLAEYFLEKNSLNYFGRKFRFADKALEKLEQLEWKGNVRELENTIIQAITKTETDVVDLKYLDNKDFSSFPSTEKSPDNYNEVDYKLAEFQFRKKYFESILKKFNGSITEAAKHAGLSRQSLYKIINELGLKI